jgi:hypothetical protein
MAEPGNSRFHVSRSAWKYQTGVYCAPAPTAKAMSVIATAKVRIVKSLLDRSEPELTTQAALSKLK